MDKNGRSSNAALDVFNVFLSIVGVVGIPLLFIGGSNLLGFAYAAVLPPFLFGISHMVVAIFTVFLPAVLFVVAAFFGLIQIGKWVVKADDRKEAKLMKNEEKARKKAADDEAKKAQDFKKAVASQNPSRMRTRNPKRNVKVNNKQPILTTDPEPGEGIKDS